MKYRVAPTQSQWVMLSLMAGAFILMAVWTVWEVRGILDPAGEDTYSEWFFDLPLVWLIPLSLFHVFVGVLFVWAGLHFIEGWIRRRGEERAHEKSPR